MHHPHRDDHCGPHPMLGPIRGSRTDTDLPSQSSTVGLLTLLAGQPHPPVSQRAHHPGVMAIPGRSIPRPRMGGPTVPPVLASRVRGRFGPQVPQYVI